VAGANHNDILSVGFAAYMEAVAGLGVLVKSASNEKMRRQKEEPFQG
jgi:hypothetical protein